MLGGRLFWIVVGPGSVHHEFFVEHGPRWKGGAAGVGNKHGTDVVVVGSIAERLGCERVPRSIFGTNHGRAPRRHDPAGGDVV